MRKSSEIFIAIAGALLISRLFEDSEMAFILLFIVLQSIVQLMSGKRKIAVMSGEDDFFRWNDCHYLG